MIETVAKLSAWLDDSALPLWAGVGVDRATETVWEALDHDGQPLTKMKRRLRVQVRQAYCFALSENPAHRDLALRLFRFAMDSGFDLETGHLAAWLAPDTSIATAPHDLYDMAFMLLAAAALLEAGFDVSSDLTRLEAELAKLKASRGWYENAERSLPRRQNPHMHLFEAMTALYKATGAERFCDGAQECLGMFAEFFLRADGCVLEFFDEAWRQVPAAKQAIEPGHMTEWVFLVDQFETVTGVETGLPLTKIFSAALDRCDDFKLLPDTSDPPSGTRRTWAQTEFLKAALVLHDRGVPLSNEAKPDAILARMWGQYLDTPVVGGWYDRRSADGSLLSDNMPASTFYHIFVAFRLYIMLNKE